MERKNLCRLWRAILRPPQSCLRSAFGFYLHVIGAAGVGVVRTGHDAQVEFAVFGGDALVLGAHDKRSAAVAYSADERTPLLLLASSATPGDRLAAGRAGAIGREALPALSMPSGEARILPG